MSDTESLGLYWTTKKVHTHTHTEQNNTSFDLTCFEIIMFSLNKAQCVRLVVYEFRAQPVLWYPRGNYSAQIMGHTGVYVCSAGARRYDQAQCHVAISRTSTWKLFHLRYMWAFLKPSYHDQRLYSLQSHTIVVIACSPAGEHITFIEFACTYTKCWMLNHNLLYICNSRVSVYSGGYSFSAFSFKLTLFLSSDTLIILLIQFILRNCIINYSGQKLKI